jgi:uncharacterized protein YecT (DUF1311 family)
MKRLIYLATALMLCVQPGDLAGDEAESGRTTAGDGEEGGQATAADRKAFEEADQELNKAWKSVIAGMKGVPFQELKSDQLGWLRYRDRMATSPLRLGVSSLSEEEIRNLKSYFSALVNLTRERTEWLRAVNRPLPAESLEGRWSDSYGGTVELVKGDVGGLRFIIEVYRGPASHTGFIAGKASWDGGIGIYSDRGKPNRSGEAIVVFVLRGERLEIRTQGTSEYEGNASYFDGAYVRVGGLSKARREAVLKGDDGEGKDEE